MKQTIYVELDALLDTRFGTIIEMDKEAKTNFAGLLATSKYSSRTSDVFSELVTGFPDQQFKATYKSRTVDVLKVSRITNIIPIIKDLIEELNDTDKYLPEVSSVSVHVNTYPYLLTDEEQATMRQVIAFYLGQVTVQLVRTPLIGLMPSTIESKYSALFMYHFDDWLTLHQNALKDTKLADILFFGPRIYVSGTPSETELSVAYGDIPKEIDPFKASEMVLSEYLSLRLIDPAAFSFVHA